MPIQTRYLFSAAMDVEPAREPLFNEVYDGEHVPLLLKVPGATRAPVAPGGDGIVLTHGASSNARAPLLVALADVFGARGLTVFRYDLPFRQARPTGPPSRGGAARDREGLRGAVQSIRASVSGRVFLGGHSYGGRQASILAAGEPVLADALPLGAYPLPPPTRAPRA